MNPFIISIIMGILTLAVIYLHSDLKKQKQDNSLLQKQLDKTNEHNTSSITWLYDCVNSKTIQVTNEKLVLKILTHSNMIINVGWIEPLLLAISNGKAIDSIELNYINKMLNEFKIPVVIEIDNVNFTYKLHEVNNIEF